ncbi:hypothetical protein HPB50_021746 [Hyalomma asiaticum]|uniref:Uncharacterized protein n=1 Tax=Hyalomma asiaticum TaxID=266040 RepID=A0ACB7T0G0_HYAAI|nr:hypothetical protein HPB50_021746 [Hyalomma asiaticum]
MRLKIAVAERRSGGVLIYVKQSLAERVREIELGPIIEADIGELAAIQLDGLIVMTTYLAPGSPDVDVRMFVQHILHKQFYDRSKLFLLVGDLNVDVPKTWFIEHMSDKCGLTCYSVQHPYPTTIRGTTIDLVFSNYPVLPVLEPLSLHFPDNKAVIIKSHISPTLYNTSNKEL